MWGPAGIGHTETMPSTDFHPDLRKVARLANDLFRGFEGVHKLPPHYGRLLEAAAYLHDVGHYVSDTRHHIIRSRAVASPSL